MSYGSSIGWSTKLRIQASYGPRQSIICWRGRVSYARTGLCLRDSLANNLKYEVKGIDDQVSEAGRRKEDW
ncbi:hypothetical protein QVD17_16487 [Tagetes erecta]|uniref:Uncharacterized protein n=1 Tax=Tagetes erecta TaxID=13708 RepID=A0AAD8KRM3_TARER|nr:hypothetical protein QVD17_16487 [Tagetes erecta]